MNIAKYRFTLPISEQGIHTLTFNNTLEIFEGVSNSGYDSKAVVNNSNNYHKDKPINGQIPIVYGSNSDSTGGVYAPNGWAFGYGTVNMSVPRTHYVEGEDSIPVTYDWDVVNTNYGNEKRPAINDAVIGIYKVGDGALLTSYRFGRNNSDGSVYRAGVTSASTTSAGLSGDLSNATANEASDTVNIDISKLEAGTYKLIFHNFFEDWYLPDTLNERPWQNLTDEITITIHEKDIQAGAFAVRDYYFNDDGTYGDAPTYYNLMGSQLDIEDVSTSRRIDHSADVTSTWIKTNPFGTNSITLTYNANEEDVKRGYVILDFDLTRLDPEVYYRMYISNISFKKTG